MDWIVMGLYDWVMRNRLVIEALNEPNVPIHCYGH